MNSGLDCRFKAEKALRSVVVDAQSLDDASSEFFTELSSQDKALARAIVTTTLRHMAQLDFLIDRFTREKLNPKSMERNFLRLGLTQLLFLDAIPAHAAISTTVEMAKNSGLGKLSGMINAILRRSQREAEGILKRISNKLPHIQPWLKKAIEEGYGYDETANIVRAMVLPARPDFRLRDESLKAECTKVASPIKGIKNAWHITDREVSAIDLPGFSKGAIYMQDAASQLVAPILADAIKEDGAILDICAAPGGKALQLSDLMPKRLIIASDLHLHRQKRTKENFMRCKANASIINAGGLVLPFADETFAGILLDAPCSSTGTTRRHIDVLYTKKMGAIPTLCKLQRRLLQAAAKKLKSGGVLVYSTCSILKAEGEEQIDKFLYKHPNFKRLPITVNEAAEKPGLINEDGDLRSLPNNEMDGFFVARLVKK